jgi:hypothetical protein
VGENEINVRVCGTAQIDTSQHLLGNNYTAPLNKARKGVLRNVVYEVTNAIFLS